ncbi:MAG: SpoIIE family protein phosphatase, partial [Ruminococcus sp.]|nr:SpoIIE family protein phosphatase [Ruminococcus sp.]
MDYDFYELGYGELYVMAVEGDKLGFIYNQANTYEKSMDSDLIIYNDPVAPVKEGHKLGDMLNFDLAEHPALKKIVEGKSKDIEFEIVTGTVGQLDFKNHYTAYSPIYFEGKLQAVVVIDYDWDDFRSELIDQIMIMLVALTVGMIISCGLVILLLSRVAVKPLSQLQSAVNEYKKTKNSEKAVESIGKIKSGNEIGKLAEDVSSLAVEIDSYMKENMSLVGERERVAAEMELAARIQKDILPKDFPNKDGLILYASMDPAKDVGGDFYDFFYIDEDHLGMVISDVSGKGMPAALFMMRSKSQISKTAVRGDSPEDVFNIVNQELCRNNDEQMFVTSWYGILEISTGKITAVNAGHEYPLIRRPNGKFELFKDPHSMFLGGLDITKYKEYEMPFEKGSTLFVFTDGVAEATSLDDELFGTDRLLEALNREPDAEPAKLLENVRKAVDE